MNPEKKRRELLHAIFIALLAALLLRQFVVAAYKIPSGSMENTLLVGDFLLVSKFVYGAKSPDWIGLPFTRWIDIGVPTGVELPSWLQIRFPAIQDPAPNDIMVFQYPLDPELDYIKRCVAKGGEEIEILGKSVLIDGKPFADPAGIKFDNDSMATHQDWPQGFAASFSPRRDYGPTIVGVDSFYMLGDNRDKSADSREWGCVPKSNLIGKPLFIYLSLATTRDKNQNLESEIRWPRLGMVIR